MATSHTIGSDGAQRDTAFPSVQAPSDSVERRFDNGEPTRSTDGGTAIVNFHLRHHKPQRAASHTACATSG